MIFDMVKEYFSNTEISIKTATGMINNLGISKDELLKDKDIVKIKGYVKENILEHCLRNNVKDSSAKMFMEDYDSVFGRVMDDDISVIIVYYDKYSFEDFQQEIKRIEDKKNKGRIE